MVRVTPAGTLIHPGTKTVPRQTVCPLGRATTSNALTSGAASQASQRARTASGV